MLKGESWRLGHRPALDGLRGVAVLLVVLYHSHFFDWVDSTGAAGVVVFFTLSGFLITTLLLEERFERGRVDVANFYLRRAARLCPALILCVAIAVALQLILLGSVEDGRLVIGTLTYSSNYVMWLGGDRSPFLGHTWSLATEEQFYLLWPLLLPVICRLPRRWQLAVLAYAVIASLGSRLMLDGWHAYFALDSRAGELLIGAALAFALHGGPVRQPGSAWLWTGLVVIGFCSFHPFGSPFTFLLMPTALALGTASVLYFAAFRQTRVLESTVLVHCGAISYGLYLFHLPLYGAARLLDVPIWIALIAAIATAECSLRFVEEPARAWVHARRRGAGNELQVGQRETATRDSGAAMAAED